jgi:hypothetical protein
MTAVSSYVCCSVDKGGVIDVLPARTAALFVE